MQGKQQQLKASSSNIRQATSNNEQQPRWKASSSNARWPTTDNNMKSDLQQCKMKSKWEQHNAMQGTSRNNARLGANTKYKSKEKRKKTLK